MIARGVGSEPAGLAFARALVDLARGCGAPVFVSARVDVALALGVGVHLPERALPAEVVRAAWPDLAIGRSCHDVAGLRRAAAVGIDYALLSPVAPPTSKAPSQNPLGIDGFGAAVAAVAALRLPVFALGGVLAPLAGPLRRAGAAGIASLGGVLAAPDPARAARELVAAWDAGAG